MNKKEAMEFLNCSPRTLIRWVEQGKIGVTYIKGKHGEEAHYSEEELARFKQELEQPVYKPAPLQPASLAIQSEEGLIRLISAIESIKPKRNRQSEPVMLSEKLLLSVSEAASLSGMSQIHIEELLAQKKLKNYAGLNGNKRLINREHLTEYIRKLK